MAEDLTVQIGLKPDQSDLDSAIQSYVQDLQANLSDTVNFQDMLQGSNEVVQAMREMKSLAQDIKDSFKQMSEFMSKVRDDASSTRVTMGGAQVGGLGGGAGGLGGLGGGLGGMLSSLGGLGGLLARVGPYGAGAAAILSLAPIAALLGVGAGGVGAALSLGTGPSRFLWQELISGTPLAGIGGQGLGTQTVGGITGRIQELFGITPNYNAYQPRLTNYDIARMYGGIRGLASSVGQGPVSMISQIVGGSYGAGWGYEAGSRLAGPLGGIAGTEIGRNLISGMMQRHIEEGMSRYAGYLQTMASMSTVGMYGGNLRTIRRARPTAYGYGPGQVGPEFSAWLQGMGATDEGGGFSGEAYEQAMQYSRLFGVGLGAQGQAIGGLLRIGGGGTGYSGEQREEIMRRVMTDAVAAGFGRRLPDFASAVGQGVSAVVQGPALITQEQLPGIIEHMSQMTGRVMGRWGVGTEGAQRIIAPWAQAPGSLLSGMMGTGGADARSLAIVWQMNRARFGNNPMAMMRGMAAAQADPLGEEGLSFLAGPIFQMLRQSPDQASAVMSIQSLFQGLGQPLDFDVAERLAVEAGGAQRDVLGEGRQLTQEEQVDLLQEILMGDKENTGDVQETMEDIAQRSQEIMREQLGAMRASAGFEAQQLAVSAAMAPAAARFFEMQLTYARTTAEIMERSEAMTAVNTLVSILTEGQGVLETGGAEAWARSVLPQLLSYVQRQWGPTGREGISAMEGSATAIRSPSLLEFGIASMLFGISNAAISVGLPQEVAAVGATIRSLATAVQDFTRYIPSPGRRN